MRLAALSRPRLLPEHPASAPPVDVRFAVGVAAARDDGGQWRYAWAAEDGTVDAAAAPQGTEGRAALELAVLAALRAADPTRPLELRIPDEDLAAAAAAGHVGEELRAAIEARNVTFPWHPSAPRGQLVRRARLQAVGQQPSQPSQPPRATVPAQRRRPETLTLAATDGSKGRGPICGWAFVTADGRHKSGTCTGNVLASELTAVEMLLRHSPRGAQLHVLVDSRAALAAIRDTPAHAARGWLTAAGTAVPHKSTLASIARLRADRTVTFAWVRGHAGQPLNDAADRLALLARRTDESARGGLPVPAGTHDRLVAQIVADMRAGLRAEQVTLTGAVA